MTTPGSTGRPLVMGTRGAIASGHYLATAAGHRIAMQGGNAVDVAAAVCFCLGVIDHHEFSLGGEVPVLIYSAAEEKVFAVSGVGFSPKAFTIDWCRRNGIDMIPGKGYLAACVPAVVGTWGLALQRFGTMSFAQVLRPAVELAEEGFPMYDGLRRAVADNADRLRREHPTTCDLYLPGGSVPAIGQRIRNPAMAGMLRTLCRAEAATAHRGRAAGIRAACDAFYAGPIAEQIVRFITDNPMPDEGGTARRGLLTCEDFAAWQPAVEEPLRLRCGGLDVHKCSSWTQGPVFCQQLAILDGVDLKGMGLNSPQYVHTWLECAKLAFADREAYYGDPLFDDVPFDVLLSADYAARRRELIGPEASMELRPGDAGGGVPDFVSFDLLADQRSTLGLNGGPDGRAECHAGDTTHLDVADAAGNMVAATPSGGWIGASPVIPDVGFPLGTRGQMFYLDARRPNALAGRKRPRATLTPTLVTRDGRAHMAFGMRGGDVQDQKTLQFFLAHVVFGLDIQQALDVPSFHSAHFPGSFYPRKAESGRVYIERRIGADVLDALRRRGHRLTVLTEVRENTMCVRRDEDRDVFQAGVCSTGEQAYALAW